MTTRAERRAEREQQQRADFDQFAQDVTAGRQSGGDDRPPRRPLLRSFRFWVPISVLLILIVAIGTAFFVGSHVYKRAMAAKTSLEKAMPLASEAADAVLAGDNAQAKEIAGRLAALTADARTQTDDDVWKSIEWLPVAGPNLYAVRTAAAVTDDLVQDALTPATDLSLAALKPKDGAIDLAGIAAMQGVISQASTAMSTAAKTLGTIDNDQLIPQVTGALDKLTGTVDELEPMLKPASEILAVLPEALGADAPKHYLLMFQNNAESRGSGGNPAALVRIDVDKGRIDIGEQASSGDFNNNRSNPITELNPETVALYGDKIGRYVQDSTLTPDFPETANIVRAWWAEEFGTPLDGVVSFDPVALGYLLKATGPAPVPNEPVDVGGYSIRALNEPLTLTAENAVPFLLSEVYSQYPNPFQQDAVFALSTRAVFDALVSGNAEPKALLESLTKAVDEGRLMYQTSNEEQAKLIGESLLSGKMPTSNADTTTVGAYVNDVTEGKLDYYLQLDMAAKTTQCSAPDQPTFDVTATITNTLDAQQAADLPRYVAPARFFKKGNIATNLVVYGPVGAKATKVMVDGKEVKGKSVPHLGRNAVLVMLENAPGQKHTMTVTYAGEAGEYGPLQVRHTPMVRTTPVAIEAPGCADDK
ncbi:DUF4012 domain-containing protein [Microbacterium sp. USHLN186]|uniref:DUF4012 domain-containing protein n=1 Tax=Microbacterium sp. USHLN186 TaxID=3081286 RepID=UPI003018BE4B